MNAAILKVTSELLVQALCLPEDTKIRNARLSDNPLCLELVLEHPDLPEVKPSDQMTRCQPELETVYAGRGHVSKTQFKGWGL